MLSIIIPTFNRKDVLKHNILALVNQDVEREVIVCDDGSIDGTKESLIDLQHDYSLPFDVHYAFQEKNGFGAGRARNMGLKIANGDKILFLDQDCLLAPNTLQKLCPNNETMYHTAIKKLVPLDFYTEKVTDDVILNNFDLISNTFFGQITATLSSCGIIYKSKLIQVDGFDEDFNEWGLEDTELISRLEDVHVHGTLKDYCFCYHIAHAPNKLSRRIQDIYRHKINHKKNDGKKVPT